jgi:uncharacterized protein YbjT (DUF2867 family)
VSKTIGILGATGLIGSQLSKLAGEDPRFSSVYRGVRRESPNPPGTESKLIDFDQLNGHDFFKVDVLFCCLGTTLKKARSKENFRKVDHDYPIGAAKELLRQNPQGHFVLVSSLGANDQSSQFYPKVKGEVESRLQELGLAQLTIVRPSLLLGDRQELRVGERIGAIAAKLLAPLFRMGLARYKPIHCKTVAKAMLNASQRSSPGLKILESEILQLVAIET